MILSTNKGVNKLQYYLGHGPNKAFLIPDLCRAMEISGDSISADFTEDIIENN